MESCCQNKSVELLGLKKKQATVLKLVLIINLVMFIVEFTFGWTAKSTALKADSLDMLGDALVYGFTLYVLHKDNKWRAIAALIKGIIIVLFSLTVLSDAIFKIVGNELPISIIIGQIGFIALFANTLCLGLLYRHRSDDINLRSTWICSRNDIISNIGVIIAAALVFHFQSKWPDIIIGLILSIYFLYSAIPILVESISEVRRNSRSTI